MNAEGSFWDHLEALRWVVVKIVVGVVITSAIAFVAMPHLFDRVILAPCHSDFILYQLFDRISSGGAQLPKLFNDGFEVKLINIQLTSQFLIHMRMACCVGVMLAFPMIIYLLWGFISPALYDHERRNARWAFVVGNVMFYLGVAVGYLLVFPLTLRFLAEYSLSSMITNQISLDSYMGHLLTITFTMGVVFELPLLCWLLSALGILKRSFFAQYRKHAVVALLVLAAFITPSGDPFTLLVVFLPIYLLYEGSALFVRK